jgi:hypothetical protein
MIIMDDYRQQQIEALQVAHEYSGKLIKGIENVSGELSGNRLLDTDAYLDEVVNGINWLIEIVNRTTDVINEKTVQIENNEVNEAVKKLADALSKKDDALIADALKNGILDFVKQVEKVTAEY